MACSPFGICRMWVKLSAWLLVAGCARLAPVATAAAADIESRDFGVTVDGKNAGTVRMSFNKADDGTTTMSCETDIAVRIWLVKYTYTLRSKEVWKNGRVQRLDSTCNDDGKTFTVSAAAQGDSLRVTVNGQEKTAHADVWLTSYWSQPDAKLHDKNISILDVDTAKDLDGTVRFVGKEQRSVAGAAQEVSHYRLTGGVSADLWYDASGRLVRHDFVEQGHRTILELARVRR
jgi:Family of unknown function (DUF6134)